MKKNDPHYSVKKCDQLIDVKTPNGIIFGFTPGVFDMHDLEGVIYKWYTRPKRNHPCCLEPKNWQGYGEPIFVPFPDANDPLAPLMMALHAHHGFRRYARGVRCVKCQREIHAAQEWQQSPR